MKTRAVVILCSIAGLAALLVQWRVISLSRHQIDDLRVESQALRTEQVAASPALEFQGVELEQLRKDKTELLRLRKEVRQLREELVALRVGRPTAAEQSPARPDEQVSRLGLAA